MKHTGNLGLHTVHINGKTVVMTDREYNEHCEKERLADQHHEHNDGPPLLLNHEIIG